MATLSLRSEIFSYSSWVILHFSSCSSSLLIFCKNFLVSFNLSRSITRSLKLEWVLPIASLKRRIHEVLVFSQRWNSFPHKDCKLTTNQTRCHPLYKEEEIFIQRQTKNDLFKYITALINTILVTNLSVVRNTIENWNKTFVDFCSEYWCNTINVNSLCSVVLPIRLSNFYIDDDFSKCIFFFHVELHKVVFG